MPPALGIVQNMCGVETGVKPRYASRLGWLLNRRQAWALIGGLVTLILVAAGWRGTYVSWQLRCARQSLIAADVERALDRLEAAEEVQPDRAELLYLKGRAHRRAGQLAQAHEYLERAYQAGWSPRDVRDQQYLGWLQAGHFDRAQPYLQEVLQGQCSDELAYEIYEATAKGYLSTYRFQDALLCLRYFIEWRPDAIQPRLWRADVWERLQRWETAGEEYRQILQREPNHLHARCRYANSLLQLNEVRAAQREFLVCLAQEPRQAQAQLGAAKCFRRLGDLARAEGIFRSLLERDMNRFQRAEILLELGQISLVRKNFEQAVESLDRAQRLEPHNPAVRHALGNAYVRAGKTQDAEQEFELALRYRSQMSRFAEITRQLIADPANADLRWEAGRILMDHGQPSEGAAWMATALAFAPDHPKTRAALAEYYSRIGQPELARQHQQVLQSAEAAGGDKARSLAPTEPPSQ